MILNDLMDYMCIASCKPMTFGGTYQLKEIIQWFQWLLLGYRGLMSKLCMFYRLSCRQKGPLLIHTHGT